MYITLTGWENMVIFAIITKTIAFNVCSRLGRDTVIVVIDYHNFFRNRVKKTSQHNARATGSARDEVASEKEKNKSVKHLISNDHAFFRSALISLSFSVRTSFPYTRTVRRTRENVNITVTNIAGDRTSKTTCEMSRSFSRFPRIPLPLFLSIPYLMARIIVFKGCFLA